MIPRTLHRIWFGQRPRPPAYDTFWDAWRFLHPGWSLITWTERNLPPLANGFLLEQAKIHARSGGIPMQHARAVAVQMADIIAYELVWRYGGVYINCDMQPLRSLEPLLEHKAFVAREDHYYLCNAVMAAEEGHPFFKRIIDELPEWYFKHLGEGMEVETGPRFLTHVAEHGMQDLTVLPRETFYFAHHGSIQQGENASAFEDRARAYGAYALHHWGHRTQEGDLRK